MKLVVLGSGVRAPFLAKALADKAGSIGIKELVFMDSSEQKINIYGKIAKNISALVDKNLIFTLTTSAEEALTDADFIISTIRVGGDEGRVLDERIALNHGILGQETTGAGGFAMAMRSIPVLKQYLELAKKYSKKDVKLFNFTNPSGLVTQALRAEGFDNIYGICDNPSEFIKELETLLKVPFGSLDAECYGLNHLSWFRNIKLDGEDITERLINDENVYKHTEMRFFDKELVQWTGNLFNGYLYYYYNREQAISNIMKAKETRGATIKEINLRMDEELSGIDIDNDFKKAYETFICYYEMREKNYMAIESNTQRESIRDFTLENFLADKNDDGYAGVALRFIESYITGRESKMVLIVPNQGAIDGLENEDTVEVTCKINKDGAAPIKIGKINDFQMNLIRQIKLFETLAAKAIKNRSILEANIALSVHPLVNSYTLAKVLVNEYLEAHKDYIGQWE